jgi:hypothetical protein
MDERARRNQGDEAVALGGVEEFDSAFGHLMDP